MHLLPQIFLPLLSVVLVGLYAGLQHLYASQPYALTRLINVSFQQVGQLPAGLWYLLLLIITGGISFYFQKLQWARQAKELQLKHYETELKYLKHQISPHFLFNTLNNIYSLCLLEPVKASEMVMQLSGMLRFMLYESQVERVLLTKELAFIEQFIYMQREKATDMNRVVFEVKGTPQHQAIAPLLLINFVENCFKHSDLSTNPFGFIRIKITLKENRLILRTSNTCSRRPMPTEAGAEPQTGGVGIENTRQRLALLYPDRHSLKITSNAQQHRVKLKIWLDSMSAVPTAITEETKQAYEAKSSYN